MFSGLWHRLVLPRSCRNWRCLVVKFPFSVMAHGHRLQCVLNLFVIPKKFYFYAQHKYFTSPTLENYQTNIISVGPYTNCKYYDIIQHEVMKLVSTHSDIQSCDMITSLVPNECCVKRKHIFIPCVVATCKK